MDKIIENGEAHAQSKVIEEKIKTELIIIIFNLIKFT